jgi:hypothetical protein
MEKKQEVEKLNTALCNHIIITYYYIDTYYYYYIHTYY